MTSNSKIKRGKIIFYFHIFRYIKQIENDGRTELFCCRISSLFFQYTSVQNHGEQEKDGGGVYLQGRETDGGSQISQGKKVHKNILKI